MKFYSRYDSTRLVFEGANLTGADLTCANLTDANLTGVGPIL